ncbi:ribonuclease T2 family protein [Niveomyces insectorum RCEF 264]|uniref:ribonuclease T2 n=1 Tax=Niveomyces insectorum RCEF 264 TaxID=1081102 RepID=A0A167PCL5_9HYPO|nr:ribonuclease T2 family protein [Niveomyces insectorum RCEF 264]
MLQKLSLRGLLASASSLLTQSPLSLDRVNARVAGDLAGGFRGPAAAATYDEPAVVPYVPLSGGPSCPIDGPTSCRNNTPAVDACCFLHPGGRVLLTQFWDSNVHAGGVEKDWTLHGLWPDNCDGSYDQFCYMAPRFDDIPQVLRQHGQDELLAFMDRYWVADRGSNAHLWAHEYNKHATCMNTLVPACYGAGYRAGVEVVDYFVRATSLFGQLDTYTALARADIRPSTVRRYPLVDVQAALERLSGGRVVLRCTGPRRDTLHEVWYVYFVQGSVQTGVFVPATSLGREGAAGNCVPWVRYMPKNGRSRSTITSSSDGGG